MRTTHNSPRWFSMRLVTKKGNKLYLQIRFTEPGLQYIYKEKLEQMPAYQTGIKKWGEFSHLSTSRLSSAFGIRNVGRALKWIEGAVIELPLTEPEVGEDVSRTLAILAPATFERPEKFPTRGPKYRHFQTLTFSAQAEYGFNGHNIVGELTVDGVRRLRVLSQKKRDEISQNATAVIKRVSNTVPKNIEKLLSDFGKAYGNEGVAEKDYFATTQDKITDSWFAFSTALSGLHVSNASPDGAFSFCGHNVDGWGAQLACFAGLVSMCQALDNVP